MFFFTFPLHSLPLLLVPSLQVWYSTYLKYHRGPGKPAWNLRIPKQYHLTNPYFIILHMFFSLRFRIELTRGKKAKSTISENSCSGIYHLSSFFFSLSTFLASFFSFIFCSYISLFAMYVYVKPGSSLETTDANSVLFFFLSFFLFWFWCL